MYNAKPIDTSVAYDAVRANPEEEQGFSLPGDGRVSFRLKAPGAKIGQLVNVSTAALIESTYGQMKKLAADAGLPLSEREFHCKGSFKALHRGKPGIEELHAVRRFAHEIVG